MNKLGILNSSTSDNSLLAPEFMFDGRVQQVI